MPILKTSVNMRVGFGATRLTNGFSVGLHRQLGTLPFRVPTPLVGIGRTSIDLGLILSRNLLTPLGYGTWMGNLGLYRLQISQPHPKKRQ